jgi:phospholipid/cholesterol/gamma-HCH transport system substrate-binding protein
VLALVLALAGALVWLKNVGRGDHFSHYAIHFDQQALDGLDIGSDVKLRGIKIGRVEDYALSGDGFNRVRVHVRVDRRAPVTTHTVAVVTRNYVTGLAAINLVNREPGGEALTAVPAGETLPVIAEGRSDLDMFAGRFNEVGELASDALESVNRLLATENRELLMATLRSVRDLAVGLEARTAALDRTLANVGGAAGDIGRASLRMAVASERIAGISETAGERLAAVAEDAGGRIAGTTTRVGERVERTLENTDLALAETRRSLAQVTAALLELQQQTLRTVQRLEDSAVSADDQLGSAATDLRATTEAMTRLLDRLRDPRAALLGPTPAQMGPGEAVR